MSKETETFRPRIKNDPANYRTRASLASAPTRDRGEPSTRPDRHREFLTAPIDAAGYIHFGKLIPPRDI